MQHGEKVLDDIEVYAIYTKIIKTLSPHRAQLGFPYGNLLQRLRPLTGGEQCRMMAVSRRMFVKAMLVTELTLL
jgi:hypothetical protein